MTTAIVIYAREIKLTRNKVALVGYWWYEWLNQWKWHAVESHRTFYATRWIKRTSLRMHRIILGLTDPKICGDHIDGNGLNCLENNLRVATVTQNSKNRRSYGRSAFLGVSFKTKNRKWVAQIFANGNKKHIGLFLSEIEAAKAYDAAAIELHGEFANLNFK